MPLSVTDRFYQAETTPPSISRLGKGLRDAYSRPADAFGAKGNVFHRSGYHRSRAWVLHSPDSRFGVHDYSVRKALDQGGSDNDVSAFDFTPADWGSTRNRRLMVELTSRVHTAAKARDPRLSSMREFAGTLDGKNVVTFNCSDGSLKDPFDDTHLDHIHGSFWRSRATADHTGVLHVLLGARAALQDREDLMFLANVKGTDEVFLTNGITARWVSAEEFPHLVALHGEGTQPLTYGGKIREVAFQSMVGAVTGPRPERLGPDEELAAILAAVGSTEVTLSPEQLAAIIDAPHNRLTAEDLPLLQEAAEAGVRRVLGAVDGATPAERADLDTP